jgi:hypothetical protein
MNKPTLTQILQTRPRTEKVEFPELIRVRQHFPRPRLEDIPAGVQTELARCNVTLPTGGQIAIAVGSRGIANIAQIVRAACDWVRLQGGKPFIIPAMGSHGGATAAGQQAVLEGYGVTEAFTGAPIRASMEVVELPNPGLPVPVYMDQHASAADGVILINRVKPHTDFHSRYESGLMKMIVIGLGKHAQALAIHQYGNYGLRELLPQVAQAVLAQGKILLGLGVVENAYDETQLVRAIPAQHIPDIEPELLALAKGSMPSLPVDEMDVLVIDRFGKDVSGAGLDTNIIGRWMVFGEPEPERPRIKTIVLGDLSSGSHGNAIGMGLADVMTRRVFVKIDWQATYENLYTSTTLFRGRMPVVVENDREGLQYALRGSNVVELAKARVVRIQDTLHLSDMLVSTAVIKAAPLLEVLDPVGELFDAAGSYRFRFG